MLPVLLGWYTGLRAILVSPLFFGVAHFHHMVERIRKGQVGQADIVGDKLPVFV